MCIKFSYICHLLSLKRSNFFKRESVFDFKVTKLDDLNNKIIPLFQNSPINGVKAEDFKDFCKVAEMMKEKKHLTEDGLKEIKKIKAGMNSARK